MNNGVVCMFMTNVQRANGRRFSLVALALVVTAALAGCASQPEEVGGLAINDPYEDTNRTIHGFNVGLDQAVIRPVARGYDEVAPPQVRLVVGNALDHLELPRDFASHVLSGELMPAVRTGMRFAVNTFFGAGGLLDPASEMNLPKEDSDIGVVLATWGFGEGAYLDLPFIGPSTVRHTVGRVGDIFLAPTTYIGGPYAGPAVTAVDVVEFRATNADVIDDVFYGSVDSYARSRALYYQNRRNAVGDGPTLSDLSGEDAAE